MGDPVRLALSHWGAIDHSRLRDRLREHPALQLMDVITERDVAVLERNTAIAEKKAAYTERDSALLQRNVAYADRYSALMERDAAVAALDMVKAERERREGTTDESGTKLIHIMNMAGTGPLLERDLQAIPRDGTDFGISYDGKSSLKQVKHGKKVYDDNARKRKASVQTGHDATATKSSSKRKKLQQTPCESTAKVEKHKQDLEVKSTGSLVYGSSVMPIPYCSCTGANQQCYRWGNGGWQSACCTNIISMYPLPMNPKKRGSRIPGRKMSGGAFKKLLEKLASEGINVTRPVDLNNHWAKHGTNRYVTIK
eukprot:c22403_g1_i1 orf=711-1646(+)